MVRWAALLFGAGGVLGLIARLLPHSGHVHVAGLVSVSVASVACAVTLMIVRDRTPPTLVRVVPLLGVVMVSVSVLFSRGGIFSAVVAMLYVWIALFVAYFESRRALVGMLLFMAVAYGTVLLAASRETDSIALWLVTIGTTAMAGYMVSELVMRLRRLAHVDSLTGLTNRRGWDVQLEREVARADRGGGPLCVAVVDLDHFKDVNDRGGHAEGDRLLRRLSRTWREPLRATDTLGRLGGDEFGVLFPNCSIDSAVGIVERLQRTMPPTTTCSVGIAQWEPGDSPAEVVRRADEALYQAKARGRGRVETRATAEAVPG